LDGLDGLGLYEQTMNADDLSLNTPKFPWYIFNPFHGMTLHDRAADFFRYQLEKRLPTMSLAPPTESAPYIYRTLVCSANLNLGLVSLASFVASAKRWPKIEMCVDESLTPDAVRRFYGDRGISVTVWTPNDLIQRLNEHNESVLCRFAEAFFWGRKTALMFGTHETVPVLYADLDVLWFQDPWRGLGLEDLNTLLSSEDRYYSYDQELLAMMSPAHREMLLSKPPHCAGLYAVPPGYKLPPEVLHYIAAKLDSTSPGYRYEVQCSIEQTSLGLATKLNGRGIPWSRLPTCPDESLWTPDFHGKNWVAAHYAGPTRRQFWRAAWSLLKR
jgi:hypothetical protein